MNRKTKAILYFLPTIFSNFKAFLKLMLAFVENKASEQYYKSSQGIKFISIKDVLPDKPDLMAQESVFFQQEIIDIQLGGNNIETENI